MALYPWKKLIRNHHDGFTLIELSVVLVIIGIIISIVATVLPSLIYSSKIKQARAVLEKIDYAIQGYSIANNRLPFAAGATDGLETNGVFIGFLPYQTLGLSSDKDPWGNGIRYAVYGIGGGGDNLTDSFADANAFCTALTQAGTAAFDANIAHTSTAAACAAADGTNSSNQAYILISGGSKDMDSANGYFDACNDPATALFNAPNKIMDTGYDDLVRTFSINELIQRICSGSGGSSGGVGTAGENTYANGCTNGTDDDGDGATDCADSDCAADAACTGGASVTITTTTIPSAVLNSTYTATISASGGTAPYEWTLTNNGGISGLALNSFTGQLTGTANQCPGAYNLILDVEDDTLADAGGPTADSATLVLEITSNITVTRTSGSGDTVTWSSTLQQETFQASGERQGTFQWSLDSDGATGFVISASGNDTAVLKKTGASAAGTYTFTITVTDTSCASNSSSIALTVTVLPAGAGVPGGVSDVSPLNIYTPDTTAYTPDAVQVSGTVSAVAFSTAASGGQGYIRTVEVNGDGSLGTGYLASLSFESSACTRPDLVHVAGNIYAVAYSGPGADGWIRTVTIDGSSGAVSQTGYYLEFDTTNGDAPSIINSGGNRFAVAYIKNNKGTIKNLSINTTTGEIASVGNAYEFESSYAAEPDIIKVNDTLFAVAYRGPSNDGWLKTIFIDDAGDTTSAGGSLEFDVSNGYEPIIHTVNSSILAVAYRGNNADCWLRTISIDSAGAVALTGSSLEVDPVDGYEPDMMHIGGDIFAITYRAQRTISTGCNRQTTLQEGWISTVGIASNGIISSTVIDTLEPPFESNTCYEPSIIAVDIDTAAIFYRGTDNRGTIVTIGFQ